MTAQPKSSAFGLDQQGIKTLATLHWDLGTAQLVEQAQANGIYGVGKRMPTGVTRALPNAALDGSLDPRETWADKDAYDAKARTLVNLFIDNFAQFEAHVDQGVRQAAPKAA